MSLYLSEWLDGPYDFGMFCDIAWSPQILCSVDKINTLEEVKVFVSLFDLPMLHSLVESLGDETGKQFTERLDKATEGILTKIKARDFIGANFKKVYTKNKGDLKKTSVQLSQLFSDYVLEIEFWNRVDFIDMLINLIFYGTPTNPKPMFFLVPPMSEWDDIDGWADWQDED
jgi:hypothetical protein